MQDILERVEKRESGDMPKRRYPDRSTFVLGEDRLERVDELTILAGMKYPSHFMQAVVDLFKSIDGPFDVRTLEVRSKPGALRKVA
jgi:hypothetical protein